MIIADNLIVTDGKMMIQRFQQSSPFLCTVMKKEDLIQLRLIVLVVQLFEKLAYH